MIHTQSSVSPWRTAAILALAAALAFAPAASGQRTATDSVRPAGTDTARRDTTVRDTTTHDTTRTRTAATTAASVGPRVDTLLTDSVHMGRRIRLRTQGVDEWVKTAGNDPKKLVLYLDGRAMQGAVAQRVSPAGQNEEWEVRLRRGSEARDAWEAVLGSPDSLARPVRVGLGPLAGPEFATPANQERVSLTLIVARPWWLFFAALGWLALIAGLIHLARTTAILRDSPAPISPPEGNPVPKAAAPGATVTPRTERRSRLELRPYSMARTQMAFWFVLVTTAYLAIWMITGDAYGVITTQALFLIGLSAGTALAAGMVESSGRKEQADRAETVEALNVRWRTLAAAKFTRAPGIDPVAIDAEMQRVEAERAAVAPDAPRSKGFFHDILTEKDEPALHRYQHFVWTLIIGTVFVVGAYQTLALPELDSTMLLLMGISAATYVGFKPREGQT